jgi:hypothetical protein
MTAAETALTFTGTFEAEVLVELMLRFWKHPLANDADFRNVLLESAAEALRASIAGQVLIEGLNANEMNLIAAIWYVEWSDVSMSVADDDQSTNDRHNWLDAVRHALPSCFTNAEFLR